MTITISADFVAWYGAILSSCVFLFEIYRYLRDHARIKITYKTEQEIWGEDASGQLVNVEKGTTFWTVNIANTGTKDIIITQVGVEYKNKKGGAVISKDYTGHIQRFTLIPGDSKTITISEKLVKHKEVRYFWVKDATGREYKKRINWW